MALILVVDDEEPIRNLIQQTLESVGHEVFQAANGLEALESQKRKPADVIFMDIIMPEKEGIETIMEIRRKFPETRVIAMSGVGLDSPYLVMAKQLGADITLDKPFSTTEIIEKVHQLLTKDS